MTAKQMEQLNQIKDKVSRCCQCQELAATRKHTVFGIGNPDAELVFIGEAPGKDEDSAGEPFVGESGQFLNDVITNRMKLRREDVYICNILCCHPPDNRDPNTTEVSNCCPFLEETLKIIKPKYLCCLGEIAAQNLLESKQSIGKLRGKVLEYKGIKVVCTYHPAYYLHKGKSEVIKKQIWDDVEILMREMGLE